MLVNMLKLQTDYRIPMPMDLGTKGQLDYYKQKLHKHEFDTSELVLLLKNVVIDLEEKLAI